MALVQYIVVRGDLKWPVGALIAQGSHASVAAIHKHWNQKNTQEYLQQLEAMHKVVLKAESQQQLLDLVRTLQENHVDHYCWREKPEEVETCVATAPQEKATLQPFFKHFKLFQ